jgi:hypothetical protein
MVMQLTLCANNFCTLNAIGELEALNYFTMIFNRSEYNSLFDSRRV